MPNTGNHHHYADNDNSGDEDRNRDARDRERERDYPANSADDNPVWRLERVLIRMEGKLDRAIQLGDDHEGRIRTLESQGAILRGKVGAVSALAGGVAGWLANAAPAWFGSHKP